MVLNSSQRLQQVLCPGGHRRQRLAGHADSTQRAANSLGHPHRGFGGYVLISIALFSLSVSLFLSCHVVVLNARDCSYRYPYTHMPVHRHSYTVHTPVLSVHQYTHKYYTPVDTVQYSTMEYSTEQYSRV